MKNILIYFLFIISFNFNALAQSSTEKWNDLNNRYEYFDTYNNMNGYKTYNSLKGQWEYYDLKKINNTRSTYQVQPPADYSATNIGYRVAMEKQKKYNSNLARVKSVIAECGELIISTSVENKEKLGMDYSNYTNMRENFNRDYTTNIGKIDLSYDSNTENLINKLKVGCAKVIENEVNIMIAKKKRDLISSNEKNTVLSLRKFKGKYKVKSVEEYKYVNKKWILNRTDTSLTEFGYFDHYITFKRSYHEKDVVRYLNYHIYDSIEHFYQYNTDFGLVYISDTFQKAIIYDPLDPSGEPTNMYVFNF